MKLKSKKLLIIFIISFLCVTLNSSLSQVLAAPSTEIIPYAYREPLPIQYEIWYSYHEGEERRNYVYRDYTFLNGYNRTDTLVGNLDLSPLEYEFYSKAQLWKVSYSFY